MRIMVRPTLGGVDQEEEEEDQEEDQEDPLLILRKIVGRCQA